MNGECFHRQHCRVEIPTPVQLENKCLDIPTVILADGCPCWEREGTAWVSDAGPRTAEATRRI